MKIDRKRLVERHSPVIHGIEPVAPLSVGNGEFAFTADFTGLQTFPESYDVPLGTQSQWGWHFTGRPNLYDVNDITLQSLDSHGREVKYPLYPENMETAYHWLRQNPHRIQLGQLFFKLLKESGEEVEVSDVTNKIQTLHLWEGSLHSKFSIDGYQVYVTTVSHPKHDEIGVKVESTLIELGRLQVVMRFPSQQITSNSWDDTVNLNWESDNRHQTIFSPVSKRSALLKRVMDEDSYEVGWSWNSGVLSQTDEHEVTLVPKQTEQQLIFSVAFSLESPKTTDFKEILHSSKKHWEAFWSSGGAIDFTGSTDPRAHELERRIVLSQFLLAIHSAGSVPPQETGLMYNSWFGKFHLEMHWWHAAHFPIWGRTPLLEKSFGWYSSIMPLAKELARSQGYAGARWPKMVGIDGKQSPSEIAPVLIWQQPHPMAMAELCYLADPNIETLKKWKEIVFDSADFMTSYAVWEEAKKAYVLGPPLIPAQECHRPEESKNPPYELEYWKFGLEIAIKWKKRLEESIPSKWIEVAQNMAEPSQVNGVYLAHENCPQTFEQFNHDHPSMVGALGMLPGSLIDETVMKNTLKKVQKEWQWETAWGWDFPMCAMTAARLGEGGMAVDFLLMEATKNTYLANGHNYQRLGLTAYLPGNGGLLTAVAMMACGWQGAESDQAPGFPQDGSWSVKWEGLKPIL